MLQHRAHSRHRSTATDEEKKHHQHLKYSKIRLVTGTYSVPPDSIAGGEGARHTPQQGQLSLASLRGRLIEYQLRLG